MIASVCYQERLFDRRVIDLNREAMVAMNRRFRGYLGEIAAVHPPREPVDLDVLAEMASCVIDGGIIMARVMGDPQRLAQQILAWRALVKQHFAPAQEAAMRAAPAIAAE